MITTDCNIKPVAFRKGITTIITYQVCMQCMSHACTFVQSIYIFQNRQCISHHCYLYLLREAIHIFNFSRVEFISEISPKCMDHQAAEMERPRRQLRQFSSAQTAMYTILRWMPTTVQRENRLANDMGHYSEGELWNKCLNIAKHISPFRQRKTNRFEVSAV